MESDDVSQAMSDGNWNYTGSTAAYCTINLDFQSTPSAKDINGGADLVSENVTRNMDAWGKATNYEIATRVPLIVLTPYMTARGKSTDTLVELVDMYPILCELAGLKTLEPLAGKSCKPILHNPAAVTRQVARRQFPTPALREWANGRPIHYHPPCERHSSGR